MPQITMVRSLTAQQKHRLEWASNSCNQVVRLFQEDLRRGGMANAFQASLPQELDTIRRDGASLLPL